MFDESLPPPPTHAPRILVVAQRPAAGRYERVLRLDGYEVRVTDDVNEASSLVADDPPDLVLLGVELENGSGFELCGDLRMSDEARLMPIILISETQDDEMAAVRGLLSGADDYIGRPDRLAELKARVRVQLRNRRDRQLLQWARQQRRVYRKEAMIDALTGVPNRRAAEAVIDTALDSGDALMLLLVDIDHFKGVNDTFGHDVGDLVLKEVAQTLSNQARKGDLVARLGGEEFVVTIHGATRDLSHLIAERFRAAVARMPGLKDGPEKVTVSVGVACIQADEGAPSRQALLRAADVALYRAKHRGRNRVEVYNMVPMDQHISGMSSQGSHGGNEIPTVPDVHVRNLGRDPGAQVGAPPPVNLSGSSDSDPDDEARKEILV